MKNAFSFWVICILVAFPSCNSTTFATIESTSPNGKVKVKVDGKREIPFDPIKTEISVKAYDFKEGKLKFEIMADDLSKDKVKFEWEDDNNCIISIEGSDKNIRSFKLIADESQVQLAEI